MNAFQYIVTSPSIKNYPRKPPNYNYFFTNLEKSSSKEWILDEINQLGQSEMEAQECFIHVCKCEPGRLVLVDVTNRQPNVKPSRFQYQKFSVGKVHCCFHQRSFWSSSPNCCFIRCLSLLKFYYIDKTCLQVYSMYWEGNK